MVYPDKNKKYVRIRKNHRNYQEELKRTRRIRIAAIAGAAVVIIGLVLILRVPSRVITAVEKHSREVARQERLEQKAAEREAAEKAAAEKEAAEKEAARKEELKKEKDSGKSEDSSDKKKDSSEKKDKSDSKKKKEEKKKKDEEGSVEVTFAGDVLITDHAQEIYNDSGIDGLVEKDLKKELKSADILEVNNEFVLSERGTPEEKDTLYRVPPAYAEALAKIGVDVAGLSNNHSLDFGKDGFDDTLYTLKQQKIKYFGAGYSAEEAFDYAKITKNGKTFGFVGATRIYPSDSWDVAAGAQPGVSCCGDYTQFVEAVQKAKEKCDYVFACVHWGSRFNAAVEEYQPDMAKALIDAGADAVVGTHPHVFSTIEYYNGKPIFYSIGNLIFGDDIEKTAIVRMQIPEKGDDISVSLIPAYAEGGQTRIAQDDRAKDIIKTIGDASPGVEISEDGDVTGK